ncbi:cell wall hydrolase [Microvirga sp. BT688]|uniref:cell wall hydrolase n=1 Tax=Microvirga sp. TaxID=1873136 RepID=UPI0016899CD8|nr:cell wall hydrolase [Microvirga sp.]MBD2745866.1 cell wall hydrolase [Microvirga sp.]
MTYFANHSTYSRLALTAGITLALGACHSSILKQIGVVEPVALPAPTAPAPKVALPTPKKVAHQDPREHECLARAMYFESNRNSTDGMIAVGTVVMNRVASPKYPSTICEVVGQRHQFADGVLTRDTPEPGFARAQAAATQVMNGARHESVAGSLYFHTAGFRIPYKDARYLVVAGGNAFYTRGEPQADRAPTFTTLRLASLQFTSLVILD